MTEERLIEILEEHGFHGTMTLGAMKQAVNEALEEAAENAELKNEFKSRPGHGSKYGGGSWKETSVDKESILNLKVK